MKQTLLPQLQEETRDDYYVIDDGLSIHVLKPPVTNTGIFSAERKPKSKPDINLMQ